MKLKTQSYLLSAIIIVSMLVLTITGLWTLRVASNLDNKSRVTELFKSTYSILNEMENLAKDGTLTEEQAKSIATRLLRKNIYKDNEYVYVADEKLNFVATPLDPQLHGTSFHDFKDGNGDSVGRILQQAVANNPNSIAEYVWTQKQANGSIEEKLSIAKQSQAWGWYVGTGIGFNEVNERFWSTAKWLITLCVLIGVAIFVILFISIRRMLSLLGGEPQEVRKAVLAVAAGQINVSFETNANSGSIYDAIQQMSCSLAQLVSNLENTIVTLRQELANVESSADVIASLTETQQQSTEMIATAMTEMSSSANNVANSARDTAENTEEADKKSLVTQQLIQSAVDNIDGLATQLGTASKAVSDLDNDVNNIVKVLDVIGDIAEQTNLLALNAAIEAARAGEQGRGFAVVADEVRNLAGRTQGSTKEIQLMIGNLQEGSRNAINTMDICAETSQNTVVESRNASEALQYIVKSLESISSMSHQIATAASEQNQVSDDISQRINMIEESGNQLSSVVLASQNNTKALASVSNELEKWADKFTVTK